MHSYDMRDVEKLLQLSRSTVRGLIAAGFVTPVRGQRNRWLFSFQDLIVLRTAQTLTRNKVPPRRITQSLKELRRQLPATMPLSGLNICAVANHVVVKEGSSRWQAESGQYLLAFDGVPEDGSLNVIEHKPVASLTINMFEKGVALEGKNTRAAIRFYEQAIVADPEHLDAHINLGRLLHETSKFTKAERIYRKALKLWGNNPLLHYNLGVLLDDMNRKPEAKDAYQAALQYDGNLADCHYNLALLYEEFNQPQEAIRHMSQYRRLVEK